MLRKKGKATQHNRNTKQHNTIFQKNASGGIRIHDRRLARRNSYQLSYPGSSLVNIVVEDVPHKILCWGNCSSSAMAFLIGGTLFTGEKCPFYQKCRAMISRASGYWASLPWISKCLLSAVFNLRCLYMCFCAIPSANSDTWECISGNNVLLRFACHVDIMWVWRDIEYLLGEGQYSLPHHKIITSISSKAFRAFYDGVQYSLLNNVQGIVFTPTPECWDDQPDCKITFNRVTCVHEPPITYILSNICCACTPRVKYSVQSQFTCVSISPPVYEDTNRAAVIAGIICGVLLLLCVVVVGVVVGVVVWRHLKHVKGVCVCVCVRIDIVCACMHRGDITYHRVGRLYM